MGLYMDKAIESMKRLDGKNGKNSIIEEQFGTISNTMHRFDEALKMSKDGEHRKAMESYIGGVAELSHLESTLIGIVDVLYGEVLSWIVLQATLEQLAPQTRNLEPAKGETIEGAVESSQYKATMLREYMYRVFTDVEELVLRDPGGVWMEHRAAHERAVRAAAEKKEQESAAGPQPGPEAAPGFDLEGKNHTPCDCVSCQLTRKWANDEIDGITYIVSILAHYAAKKEFVAVQECADKAMRFALEGTEHAKSGRTLVVTDVQEALEVFGIHVLWDESPAGFILRIPPHLLPSA